MLGLIRDSIPTEDSILSNHQLRSYTELIKGLKVSQRFESKMDNISDTHNLNRDLFCILFPGIVKNDEKALECLGGIKTISEVYAASNKKRLPLSFQPQNQFIKKTMSDIKKTPGVLFKVRIRKTNVDGVVHKEVDSVAVMGRIQHVLKFDAMSDFQYLPVRKEGNEVKCFWEDVVPSGVVSSSWLQEPAPFYVVPRFFTRSDRPFAYHYTLKKSSYKGLPDVEGRAIKNPRVKNTFFFSLTEEYPTEPDKSNLSQLLEKFTPNSTMRKDYEDVQKIFDERPVWSLSALAFKSKLKRSVLKIILPCIALYFAHGPWNKLWVRLGYDVRKEPSSRIYQTLDFRVRANVPKLISLYKPSHFVDNRKGDRKWHFRSEETSEAEVQENAVIFRPGMVPAQKQIYYQFCDIKLPEVEEMLLAEPSAEGLMCHQQRGWLPPDFAETCRDYIIKYAMEAASAISSNAEFSLEQASSEEEFNSDEEDDSETVIGV